MSRDQRFSFDSRRRRQVPGGRPISYRISLSKDEAEQLVARADEEGVTVARLVVELALTGLSPSERRESIHAVDEANRLLRGLCTNVNQLARWANTQGRFPTWAADLPGQVDDVLRRMQRAVDPVVDQEAA